MINESNYLELKEKFGHIASWAIWKMPGEKPKSNTSDLSVFNDEKILDTLNTNYVFVGLKAAPNHGNYNADEHDWHCFHSAYFRQNDYKLRYALADTKFWGSYITDIIKEPEEIDSPKNFITKNIKLFEEELKLLGENPTLIAMGAETYDILNKYLGKKYKICNILSYAYRISKEKYREEVLTSLKNI